MHEDAHGKRWFSLPLGVPFDDLLSQLSVPELKLLNSLMSHHSMPPATTMLPRKQRPELLTPAFTTMLSCDQRPEPLPSARVLPLVTVLNSGLRC